MRKYKKIYIEKLVDWAWEWFNRLPTHMRDEIVLRAYTREMGLKEVIERAVRIE